MKVALLGLVLGVAACQDNVSTPFPPGLEPFSDSDAPDALPQVAEEVLQHRSIKDNMIRVYGRGTVFASPAALWEASKRPELMIATCNTTRQVISPGTEPEYELTFMVHYVVEDILTVEWDDQWRGDVVLGTAEAPELVFIKHQKVQGSDFISLSEGSVQILDTDDPEVSELWFVEHLDAISGSADDVLQGMQQNYKALVAAVHGQPIPTCRQ
ncbi:MAG: hypothetical protein ACTHU0_39880 [Kofleriaceae bacterium]